MKTIEIEKIVKKIEDRASEKFAKFDTVSYYNVKKTLIAMRNNRVSEIDFRSTTGYGYGDSGRDKLGRLWAEVMDAEAGLVRSQIASGTHAIACALYGVLRPGDHLLSVTGQPYDTLQTVIGYKKHIRGSLQEWGIHYAEVDFIEDNIDFSAIKATLNAKTKLVMIQRSRGYRLDRPSLSVEMVGKIIETVKTIKPDCLCMVDNCYCEFVEINEPPAVGADLCVGSLIKNPGGGIAASGGYIVGTAEAIAMVADRLIAPGIGADVGCSLAGNRLLYQGLFMASHITNQALKTAVLVSGLLQELGYEVAPTFDDDRADIVQAIRFADKEKMLEFCQQIQRWSPVDAYVNLEPSVLPGYDVPVIMAAGTFVQGSSIELSADGPVKPPYVLYVQGSLMYEHSRIAIIEAAKSIMN